MIVNYQLVGGSGWTLLFNEAGGDANEDFAPQFRDQVQKASGYGAANQVKVPLANTDGQVTFKWSSNYATPAAATAAIATLRSTFKGVSVHLQIVNGATTVYLRNAAMTGSSHKQRGIECWHTISFDTDDISTT